MAAKKKMTKADVAKKFGINKKTIASKPSSSKAKGKPKPMSGG